MKNRPKPKLGPVVAGLMAGVVMGIVVAVEGRLPLWPTVIVLALACSAWLYAHASEP